MHARTSTRYRVLQRLLNLEIGVLLTDLMFWAVASRGNAGPPVMAHTAAQLLCGIASESLGYPLVHGRYAFSARKLETMITYVFALILSGEEQRYRDLQRRIEFLGNL